MTYRILDRIPTSPRPFRLISRNRIRIVGLGLVVDPLNFKPVVDPWLGLVFDLQQGLADFEGHTQGRGEVFRGEHGEDAVHGERFVVRIQFEPDDGGRGRGARATARRRVVRG